MGHLGSYVSCHNAMAHDKYVNIMVNNHNVKTAWTVAFFDDDAL
jgi:hypothetical protein